MRVLSLIIVGLMLSNCSNSYVKNKKTITSPDDLMKFTNVWCEKQKQTNNTIKMCGQGWSKDLNISESKAIIDAKLKIADITQHSIIKSEKIIKKENSKGITQSYELNADNTLNEATIVGYKIVSKKVMKDPEFSHFTFQSYEVQSKCRMCSLTPHTDDTHYAAVLSLNYDEEMDDTDNGTAFWRHAEYDEEFVSSD